MISRGIIETRQPFTIQRIVSGVLICLPSDLLLLLLPRLTSRWAGGQTQHMPINTERYSEIENSQYKKVRKKLQAKFHFNIKNGN